MFLLTLGPGFTNVIFPLQRFSGGTVCCRLLEIHYLSKKDGKDQQTIQSSTTHDSEYHMGM